MRISGQWTPAVHCPGGPSLGHGDHCPNCHGCHSGRLHFPNVYRQMPSLPIDPVYSTAFCATSTGSSGAAIMVLIVAEDKKRAHLCVGKVLVRPLPRPWVFQCSVAYPCVTIPSNR